MIILGIDPGTIKCGYGFISFDKNVIKRIDSGTFYLQTLKSMPEKLEKIYDELSILIKKHKADELSIETAFYGKNIQSALKIGLARGAAILSARHSKLNISEYSPREIKKAVTGNGAASKEQVLYMVQTLLNQKTTKFLPDESDALAIAICHSFRLRSHSSKPKSWKDFASNFPERIIG